MSINSMIFASFRRYLDNIISDDGYSNDLASILCSTGMANKWGETIINMMREYNPTLMQLILNNKYNICIQSIIDAIAEEIEICFCTGYDPKPDWWQRAINEVSTNETKQYRAIKDKAASMFETRIIYFFNDLLVSEQQLTSEMLSTVEATLHLYQRRNKQNGEQHDKSPAHDSDVTHCFMDVSKTNHPLFCYYKEVCDAMTQLGQSALKDHKIQYDILHTTMHKSNVYNEILYKKITEIFSKIFPQSTDVCDINTYQGACEHKKSLRYIIQCSEKTILDTLVKHFNLSPCKFNVRYTCVNNPDGGLPTSKSASKEFYCTKTSHDLLKTHSVICKMDNNVPDFIKEVSLFDRCRFFCAINKEFGKQMDIIKKINDFVITSNIEIPGNLNEFAEREATLRNDIANTYAKTALRILKSIGDDNCPITYSEVIQAIIKKITAHFIYHEESSLFEFMAIGLADSMRRYGYIQANALDLLIQLGNGMLDQINTAIIDDNAKTPPAQIRSNVIRRYGSCVWTRIEQMLRPRISINTISTMPIAAISTTIAKQKKV